MDQDQGDEQQFCRFVAAQMDSLRRLAYLSCGNWNTAEDAVATALSKLYARWRSVDSPEAYARTMVVRAAIDETRRPWWARERSASDAPPDVQLPDHDTAVVERLDMMAALLQVPARQRMVLVLRFYQGLDVRQTATDMGCSESTVRSQTVRGLAALSRALQACGHHLRDQEMEKADGVSGSRSAAGRRVGRADA